MVSEKAKKKVVRPITARDRRELFFPTFEVGTYVVVRNPREVNRMLKDRKCTIHRAPSEQRLETSEPAIVYVVSDRDYGRHYARVEELAPLEAPAPTPFKKFVEAEKRVQR